MIKNNVVNPDSIVESGFFCNFVALLEFVVKYI